MPRKFPSSSAPRVLRGRRDPLVLLVVLFFVVVGAVVFTSRGDDGEDLVEIIDVGARNRLDDPIDVEQRFAPFDAAVPSWGQIDDGSPDGQRLIPVSALEKACAVVSAFSWARFKLSGTTARPDRLGFDVADVPALFANPAGNRGEPVEFLGRLVNLEPVDLFSRYGFKLPDGRYEAFEGTLISRAERNGSAVPVRFTLVDEPSGEIPLPGTPVKLQGVFFKLHALASEEGADLEPGIWILAKRLMLNFEMPEPGKADLSMLEQVRDASLADEYDRSPFADSALFHLMGAVLDRSPFAAATPLPLASSGGRELLTDPQDFRGRVVEFQARVLRIEHHSMDAFFPENIQGDNRVHEFWHAYVTLDGSIPLTVMCLEPPPQKLLRRDHVALKAVFYRNWAYLAKGTKSTPIVTGAPWLVALGPLQRVELPVWDGFDAVVWGILAFTVLTICVLFFVLRADRKRARLFAAEMRVKRQIQRGSLDLDELARREAAEAKEPT